MLARQMLSLHEPFYQQDLIVFIVGEPINIAKRD
jgi:hypothetical protein